MARKSNWDHISKQQPSDTTKFRDVYDDQQLERSRIEGKQSPLSRIILVAILTVIVAIIAYVFASLFSFGSNVMQSSESSGGTDVSSSSSIESNSSPRSYEEYAALHGYEDGMLSDNSNNQYFGYIGPDGQEYTYSEMEQMWRDSLTQTTVTDSNESGATDVSESTTQSGFSVIFAPSFGKVLFTFFVAALFFGIMYEVMMRNLEAQNLMNDTSDINQYHNDQHIALPEEIQRKFDWFPDVGAHSNVQFSSMISHVALLNKGLKKIQVAQRAENDILDEDGDIEYYKGEVILDDDGNAICETKPMIDMDFMDALFDASGLPKDKVMRKYYDATKIPYNPDGSDRDKLGKFATVADLINEDWTFPSYESQRPAGAYLVDTAPVNTMVLAITRAGKGQWFGPFTHLFHYQWGKLVM